jgi:hypothetical protein
MNNQQTIAQYLDVIPKEIATGNDRGDYFAIVRDWVLLNYGEEGVAVLKLRIGTDISYLLDKACPQDWYPTHYSARVYEALFEITGRQSTQIADYVHYYVGRQLEGFLKQTPSAVHPLRLALRAGNVWANFHDHGSLAMEIVDTCCVRLAIRDWWGSPVHCLVNKFFFIELLKKAGARDVSCRELNCVHRGDDCCRWEISWA